MYCKNCGKEIDDSSRYCKFCGTDLSENEISRNPDKNGSGYRTNVQLDGKINYSLDPNQVTSIKALNEQGLYRDGLDSNEIRQILTTACDKVRR